MKNTFRNTATQNSSGVDNIIVPVSILTIGAVVLFYFYQSQGDDPVQESSEEPFVEEPFVEVPPEEDPTEEVPPEEDPTEEDPTEEVPPEEEPKKGEEQRVTQTRKNKYFNVSNALTAASVIGAVVGTTYGVGKYMHSGQPVTTRGPQNTTKYPLILSTNNVFKLTKGAPEERKKGNRKTRKGNRETRKGNRETTKSIPEETTKSIPEETTRGIPEETRTGIPEETTRGIPEETTKGKKGKKITLEDGFTWRNDTYTTTNELHDEIVGDENTVKVIQNEDINIEKLPGEILLPPTIRNLPGTNVDVRPMWWQWPSNGHLHGNTQTPNQIVSSHPPDTNVGATTPNSNVRVLPSSPNTNAVIHPQRYFPLMSISNEAASAAQTATFGTAMLCASSTALSIIRTGTAGSAQPYLIFFSAVTGLLATASLKNAGEFVFSGMPLVQYNGNNILEDAPFRNSTLQDAPFRNSTLQDTPFRNSTLQDAPFRDPLNPLGLKFMTPETPITRQKITPDNLIAPQNIDHEIIKENQIIDESLYVLKRQLVTGVGLTAITIGSVAAIPIVVGAVGLSVPFLSYMGFTAFFYDTTMRAFDMALETGSKLEIHQLELNRLYELQSLRATSRYNKDFHSKQLPGLTRSKRLSLNQSRKLYVSNQEFDKLMSEHNKDDITIPPVVISKPRSLKTYNSAFRNNSAPRKFAKTVGHVSKKGPQ